MNIHEWIRTDLDEVTALLESIDAGEAEQLGDMISAAQSVYLTGQGRSGLMIRAFGQRLMQMGMRVFIVGEIVTPAIGRGDLLIVGSGSGETPSATNAAQKARQMGANVVALTADRDSTLGRLADHVVFLPGGSPKVRSERTSRLPLGSVLEQSLLIFLDAIGAKLAEERGISYGEMMARHANLE